jgi:hypothetical protein
MHGHRIVIWTTPMDLLGSCWVVGVQQPPSWCNHTSCAVCIASPHANHACGQPPTGRRCRGSRATSICAALLCSRALPTCSTTRPPSVTGHSSESCIMNPLCIMYPIHIIHLYTAVLRYCGTAVLRYCRICSHHHPPSLTGPHVSRHMGSQSCRCWAAGRWGQAA